MSTVPETSSSTQEHPNALLMREFFAAFGSADRERMHALMADDLIYHFPGTSPISGDWPGVDGLLDGIRAVAMSLGRGNNAFELLHVFADDHVAITVHQDSYHGSDNHLNLRYFLFVTIADGKMTEVWEVPFDQAENDRYFAVQAAALARLSQAGG